jgi:hypothetical protein
LSIDAPHFVAGVVFEHVFGVWQVERAAPIVQYMQRMSAADIERYINRKGWRYEWSKLGD